MDADPNLDLHSTGPVVLGKSTLTSDRRCHRFLRPAEGDDEGIALRSDLTPAMLREGRAEQPVVLQEQITVPIAQPDHLVQRGRAVPMRLHALNELPGHAVVAGPAQFRQ